MTDVQKGIITEYYNETVDRISRKEMWALVDIAAIRYAAAYMDGETHKNIRSTQPVVFDFDDANDAAAGRFRRSIRLVCEESGLRLSGSTFSMPQIASQALRVMGEARIMPAKPLRVMSKGIELAKLDTLV